MAFEVTTVICLALCVSFAVGDVLRFGFPTEVPKKADSNHWAVLVAGSSGWYNYRHQADVCHAYHVLKNHGFSEDRIITLMYDDIARNEENPTPGIIINHPNGSDVYAGVNIDYAKEEVTPDTFLAVLRGDSDAVQGLGSGRVLKSGPDDHVFVNFVDHGAPGILGFPSEMLKARQLLDAINYMNKNQMYKQMVFYVEACESGSIFNNLLPDNINVYATTAANSHESSYACYLDDERNTYLGDVYSVKWMEDSDAEDLSAETLHKQYKIVREETNTSHVQQFGDKSISKEDVAEFQGGVEYVRPKPIKLPNAPLDAVPSEDVPLALLQHRLRTAASAREEEHLLNQLNWLTAVHGHVDALMKRIVSTAAPAHLESDVIYAARHPLADHDCYEEVVDAFSERCVSLPQNDYALRRLYLLVNLCEEQVPAAAIVRAIRRACATNAYM